MKPYEDCVLLYAFFSFFKGERSSCKIRSPKQNRPMLSIHALFLKKYLSILLNLFYDSAREWYHERISMNNIKSILRHYLYAS